MTKNAEYQAAYYKRHKYELKKKIYNILGKKCSICGYNDLRALEIDHTFGGGSIHRKNTGGIAYWKDIIKSIKNKKIRILCRNCNWIEFTKRKKMDRLAC